MQNVLDEEFEDWFSRRSGQRPTTAQITDLITAVNELESQTKQQRLLLQRTLVWDAERRAAWVAWREAKKAPVGVKNMVKHTFKWSEDGLAKLFKIGTVLWRGCGFMASDFRYVEYAVVPEKTEKGSYMLRCKIEGSFIHEPEVYGKEEGRKDFGIVVFINEELPRDWSHLVVTGVSKAMNFPQETNGKGNCIFAKVGATVKDYGAFRSRLAREVSQNLNEGYEKMLDIHLRHWPEEFSLEERRLMTRGIWGDGGYVGFNFAHLRRQPE